MDCSRRDPYVGLNSARIKRLGKRELSLVAALGQFATDLHNLRYVADLPRERRRVCEDLLVGVVVHAHRTTDIKHARSSMPKGFAEPVDHRVVIAEYPVATYVHVLSSQCSLVVSIRLRKRVPCFRKAAENPVE